MVSNVWPSADKRVAGMKWQNLLACRRDRRKLSRSAQSRPRSIKRSKACRYKHENRAAKEGLTISSFYLYIQVGAISNVKCGASMYDIPGFTREFFRRATRLTTTSQVGGEISLKDGVTIVLLLPR